MIHLDAEELYISAVLLPIVLSVLTQIMLCLAEAVLRNRRFFA
jgi:hypothetical protein